MITEEFVWNGNMYLFDRFSSTCSLLGIVFKLLLFNPVVLFQGFEQGASGFVKSLIGKHEIIKQEYSDEVEERRRSRVYSSTDEGLVPTRTASFANAEKPEVCMQLVA